MTYRVKNGEALIVWATAVRMWKSFGFHDRASNEGGYACCLRLQSDDDDDVTLWPMGERHTFSLFKRRGAWFHCRLASCRLYTVPPSLLSARGFKFSTGECPVHLWTRQLEYIFRGQSDKCQPSFAPNGQVEKRSSTWWLYIYISRNPMCLALYL